jgi:hypothetical protein
MNTIVAVTIGICLGILTMPIAVLAGVGLFWMAVFHPFVSFAICAATIGTSLTLEA